MKIYKILVFLSLLMFFNSTTMANDFSNNNNDMIVRISEVEIYPQYLNDYITFAKEVAESSVAKEKGVIAIYPMIQIKDNNQIRILEIYKNQEAYNLHIQSEHFEKYKKGTFHMIKSLELIDNYQLSQKNFNKIFKRR